MYTSFSSCQEPALYESSGYMIIFAIGSSLLGYLYDFICDQTEGTRETIVSIARFCTRRNAARGFRRLFVHKHFLDQRSNRSYSTSPVRVRHVFAGLPCEVASSKLSRCTRGGHSSVIVRNNEARHHARRPVCGVRVSSITSTLRFRVELEATTIVFY